MVSPRSLKVFVVEDDAMQLEILMDYLGSSTSHVLYRFRTGEEALQRMDSVRPDAVILDFNLDSVNPSASNGLVILESVKKRYPETQVIILSSQESYATAMQTIRKGAEQYVLKSEPDVHAKIAQLLAELS